jgi:Rrf2 family protein
VTLASERHAGDEPPGVRSLRIPARVDDALRALLVLAAAPEAVPVKLTEVSEAEGLSPRFLSTVLVALRDHGLVHSHRGATGGYWLARPADEITVADVYDAVDARPPVPAPGSEITVDLWRQLETELRARLSSVTVADLLA